MKQERSLLKQFTLIASAIFWLSLNLQAQLAPTITSQPTNQIVIAGGTARFSVTAAGTGPFTYQWLFNGTNSINVITNVAGNGISYYSGDGGAATSAELYIPGGVAVDAYGNLFIADTGNNVIRKVGTNGIITTVAGNGLSGYTGNGGAATSAKLNSPSGVTVDAYGNLYIADTSNNVIRKVGTNGIITTVAGNRTSGYSGDGGAATNSQLDSPISVAVDVIGNLLVADAYNNVIRKVGTNGIITTMAGNGYGAKIVQNGFYKGGYYAGDGGVATSAELSYPTAVALDASGNLFIADAWNNVIRKVGTNGIITTVAGKKLSGYSGDGGAATNSHLFYPDGVTVDAYNNLFIADSGNNVIRKVDTNGVITTVMANGYSSDGGVSTIWGLSSPEGIAVDASGSLFIADAGNQRICEVVPPGAMLAVNKVSAANEGAYDVVISNPYGSVTSSVVTLQLVLPPSIISYPQPQSVVFGSNATFTVAATGTAPFYYKWYFNGSAIPSQTSKTLVLSAVGFTNAGSYTVVVTNLYGSITSTAAILTVGIPPAITSQPQSEMNPYNSTATFSVTATGTGPLTYQWLFNGTNLPSVITTVAGSGTHGYSGNGGTATSAELSAPGGVAVDAHGNLFIADTGNSAIRKVGTNGIITTVAGNGTYGYSGNGGTATSAKLNNPGGVTVDVFGNLFIADTGNSVIRKVGTNGIITTVAGNGTYGYSGNGGAATSAKLDVPISVAVDASGNLFIADAWNNVIRKVGTNGIISTVAGNGYGAAIGGGYSEEGHYTGDGGKATSAELSYPTGVALDTFGNLFIADSGNNVIRKVGTNGIITTVAGNNGTYGYSGDGGSATNAQLSLNDTIGIAVDASGNLFIADSGNNVIRMVGTNGIITTVAGDNGMYWELYNPCCVAVDASGNLLISDYYGNVVREVVGLSVSTPALTLLDVKSSNAGNYALVISSPYGSVTSSIVTLTVSSNVLGGSILFVKSGIQYTNGQFHVGLSGLTGLGSVVIEASTNLTQWTPIFTNLSGPATIQFNDPSARNYASRFYRAVAPAP